MLVKTKICLAGDAQVGKTSLIGRFVHNVFSDKYLYTIGTKVSRKEIILKDPQKKTDIKMEAMIWDIMGQKTFRNLFSEKYFSGASGIIAVCNLTERESLKNLYEWVTTARRFAGDVPVIIFANKKDLKKKIKFRPNELEKVASDLNAPFMLTSAKTGENVIKGFLVLGNEIANSQLVLA